MKNSSGSSYFPIPRFPLIIILEVICFIIDLFIPRGFAVWIFYIFPMLLIWNTTAVQIIITVVLVSIFQVAGFIFSPESGVPFHIALTNKIAYLLVFWIVSIVFVSRKRAEQELRKSEERLRLATEATQLGIFDWDIKNDLPLWDRRMYEIFGVDPDGDPINRDVFTKEVIHPDDLKRFNQEIAESMNRGSTFNGSYRIRRRSDGKIRWIQYFGKFTLSPEGTPVRLVSTLADITERKEVEQDLQERDDRLRILNENLENLVVRRTEQVRVLSKTLTLAEQRERKQFSQILHEDIQQKLFGARILFKQYLRDLQAEGLVPQREDIEDGVEVLEQALTTTKALSIELNPPILSTEGLDAALRWLVTHMLNTYELKVDLQIQGNVENVRNETQLMLIQMIREILNNVKQHAGVMNAQLTVDYKGEHLKITINDSGRGFDPEKVLTEKVDENRLGLLSIKERLKLFGGDLTIQSGSETGTRVTIVLPYKNQRQSFKDTI